MIDATEDKSACWQIPNPLAIVPYSEDCLFLNVWTNEINTERLKPVMFFIHGGNLQFGTAFSSLYNGKVLSTYDVVVVVINYRLGKFGFLYGGDDSAPGNAGIYDQLLALHWVSVSLFVILKSLNMVLRLETIFIDSVAIRIR